MDLTSLKIIKDLLSRYETRPSKGLGQNFLIDKNVLNKIINSADIKPNDIILEVGPGIGTLTQELAKKAKKVIAVEKDKTMIEILEETTKNFNNIEIINADILRYKIQTINYKLIANIPYYLTSPLIRKFLELKNPPQEMILMLQKEVAQRICSSPPTKKEQLADGDKISKTSSFLVGGKPPSPPTNFGQEKIKTTKETPAPKLVGGKMSLLAVSVQFYAEPKIISYVSKNCFWPSPKVDSAIIKIKPQINADREKIDADLFFKVVKAGFSQPRKQLCNNLLALSHAEGSKILKIDKKNATTWLLKNKINPTQRAETLSIEDWIGLVNSL